MKDNFCHSLVILSGNFTVKLSESQHRQNG